MLRKTLYILFVALCAATAIESYARYRFADLVDRSRFEEMAFIRLLNSGVIYHPGTGNYDQRFGFLLTPNSRETVHTDEYRYTIRTNSLGFRTHELEPKPQGQRRLMLLGDSMFFGVGVDYPASIPALLEQRQDSLKVYNFATLGHNTAQALIAARAFSNQVEPDLILCGVFIGNDLISNALNYADEQNHIATHHQQVATTRNRLLAALAPYAWSTTTRALAYSIYVPRLRYQLAAETDIIAATIHHLAAIKSTAGAAGSDFATILIYPKDAVGGGLIEQWSQSRYPGRLLARACREQGIKVLDLVEHITGAADERRYYFEQDGHFNATGNTRVAELIYEHWLEPTH